MDLRRVSFVVEIFAESSGCRALRSTFHHSLWKRLQACKHCSSSNKDIIPSISARQRRDVYQFIVPSAPSVKVSQFLLKPDSPSWIKLSVPFALLSSFDNAQIYCCSRDVSSMTRRALVLFVPMELTLEWKTGTRLA